MAINFSTMVYFPAMNTFAVPLTIYPSMSRPGVGPLDGRGILSTQELPIMAEDGSIITSKKTILDILMVEWDVLPQQSDQVLIPYDCNGEPRGLYEILSRSENGGGQMTFELREMVR
jgi:hypothetical protein